jgi:hypothetical protein
MKLQLLIPRFAGFAILHKNLLKKHQTSKTVFIIGELDLDCLF